MRSRPRQDARSARREPFPAPLRRADRHGPPAVSGLIVGLLAYVAVLVPVFVLTDDVSLDEDLNAGGLAFLAFLAVPLAASALVGATVGELIARWRHPDRQ